jgi:hypothetical protein
MFGKKDIPEPVVAPEAPVAELVVALPPAPEAAPLFPEGLPVALQETFDGLANLSA